MTRCYRCTFDDGTTGSAAPSFAATAPQTHTAEAGCSGPSGARAGAIVGQAAGAPTPAAVTFSDPGDGYDGAIWWHADLERGSL